MASPGEPLSAVPSAPPWVILHGDRSVAAGDDVPGAAPKDNIALAGPPL